MLCPPWSSFLSSINFLLDTSTASLLFCLKSFSTPDCSDGRVKQFCLAVIFLESKSKIAERTDFSPTHTLGYTDLKSLHFSFHQLIYTFARHTFKLHLRFVSWRIRKEADTQQLQRSTLTSVAQVATQAHCCVKATELEMSRKCNFLNVDP